MNFLPAEFHFLRPWWLFALIPSILLFVAFLLLRMRGSQWSKAVNRDLLPHLLDGGESGGRSGLLTFLLLAWTIAVVSMAGPAWNKLPQPVHEKQDALVIIQDLSLSFFAQDLSPDRMTRARRKLVDILKQRKEGTTALVVYSADAHTIVPLTDDIRTIENMVPALSPSIMPGYGSNVVAAVKMGVELLKNGTGGQGRMLLITDEVTADDVEEAIDILDGRSITLSVIGVGTENGGPVPKKDGGFWKDRDGSIIVPKMDRLLLKRLAKGSGGRYSDITLTDNDIDFVLAEETLIVPESDVQRLEREFDTWQDMGSRLVVLIIPFALVAFRRGLIIALMLFMIISSSECHAMSWDDLWLTRDQQAARALGQGNYKSAAENFKTQGWRGVANYKNGEFSEAADVFSGLDNADGYYNQGNALAKSGDLAGAIKAYDKAIEREPEMEDALHNRDLVKKLLEQQKQQQQQGNGQDGSDRQNGQEKDSKKDQAGENDQDKSSENGGQQKEQEGSQSYQDSENKENNESSDSSADAEQMNAQQKEDSSEEQKSASTSRSEQAAKKEEIGEESDGSVMEGKELSEEDQQKVDQLLRKIPDDPGGLLRRKFQYEYQLNRDKINSNKNNKIW